MIKKIALAIWNMSEFYKIPLGRFAPYLFGIIVGSKPKHKRKDKKC